MTTPIPPTQNPADGQQQAAHIPQGGVVLSAEDMAHAQTAGEKLGAAILIQDISGEHVDINNLHVHYTIQYVLPGQTPNPPSQLETIDAEHRRQDKLGPAELRLPIAFQDYARRQRYILELIKLMFRVAGIDYVVQHERPGSTLLQIILPDHAVTPFIALANSGEFTAISITAARRVYILNNAPLANAKMARFDLSAAYLKNADFTNTNLQSANLSYAVGKGANFTAADLDGANLSHANLTDAVLRRAKIFNANLTDAQLDDADLRLALYNHLTTWPVGFNPHRVGALGPRTVMPGVSLARMNLADADLYGSRLPNVDFSNANLSRVTLDSADLSGANLCGANLSQASLQGTVLTNAIYDGRTRWPQGYPFHLVRAIGPKSILTNAEFTRAVFTNLDLGEVHLAAAKLTEANLSGSNLTNANLSNAGLSLANLKGARLAYTNFTHAQLTSADLSQALLRRAVLDRVNAPGAKFIGANLQGASLIRAYLHGIDATNADFSQTDLRGADLTDASLIGCNFSGARYNHATVWPTGFIPTADMIYVPPRNSNPASEPPPVPVTESLPPPHKISTQVLEFATRIGVDVTFLFFWLAYAFAINNFVTAFTITPTDMLRFLQIFAVTLTLLSISAFLIIDLEDIATWRRLRNEHSVPYPPEYDLNMRVLTRILLILAAGTIGFASVMFGIYLYSGLAVHLFSAVIAALAATFYAVVPFMLSSRRP